MIQANELRIGNKFYFPFHNESVTILGYAKIESNNSFKIQFETKGGILLEPLSILKPISLNREILEKCGAIHNKPDWYYFHNDKEYRFYLDDNSNLHCSITPNDSTEGILYKIVTYLHQLQNLYYALTGEELEVNL